MKIWTKILAIYQLTTLVFFVLCLLEVIPLSWGYFLFLTLIPTFVVVLIWSVIFIYFVYKNIKPYFVNLYLAYELKRISKQIDKLEKQL